MFEVGEAQNIFAKDRDFQKALYEIFRNAKDLDEGRLLHKIRYHFNDLNIRQDFKGYKRVLGKIYNVRLTGDKRHIVTEDAEDAPQNQEQPKLELEQIKKPPITEGFSFST